MIKNRVKNSEISMLGMGGMRFPCVDGNPNIIDREKGQELIDAAISAGINYFDSAYIYQNGDSEKFLGEALSKYPRESYYLATKYYSSCGKSIDSVFEEQLINCKTDYFDFYLLHSMDENFFAEYTDPEKDYIGFLNRQKKAGKIRNIGFSSHASPEVLKRFLDIYDGYDMALIQLNYLDSTLLDAMKQYELLTEHNIPVWVMEPLKGGRLAKLNDEAAKILKTAVPGNSIASWSFRWFMSLENIVTVLSGMTSVEIINENAEIFSQRNPLSENEKSALNSALKTYIKDLGIPCSACRYCCSSCPAQLDIPLLIKGYNEQKISGETWRIAALDRTKSANECLQCGACLKHCPQKINIPKIMKELQK